METAQRKFTVRPYELEDLPWTVELASYRSIVEEAKRPDLVNKPAWYQVAMKILNEGIGLIGECNGERVGMIGSLLIPHMFNPDIVTSSVVTWYVLPEFRKSRISVMLLNRMEERSKEESDTLTFSLLGDNLIKNGPLEKRGMRLTEVAYTKQFGELDYGS